MSVVLSIMVLELGNLIDERRVKSGIFTFEKRARKEKNVR